MTSMIFKSLGLHFVGNLFFLFCFFIVPGNDTFAQVNDFNPKDWSFASQRDEISPVHFINNNLTFRENYTLTLSGGGKEYANGCWYNIVNIIPGKYYQFKVHYSDEQVEEPSRSILARILWLDENEKLIGTAEYPRTLPHKTPESWNIIEQVYKSPQNVSKAKLELVYRWDANGSAHFGDVLFKEVNEFPTRVVKLATVYHRPRGSKSSSENLDQFAKLIEKAGERNADIICLPEAIMMVGTKHSYISASEPIPGPTTNFLGELSERYNMYIVAGLLEREGDVVYNTAVLIDRTGSLIGKYRKVSLPREEIEGGITPGDSIPVFDTDFGRIGIMICWDVFFPEVARALALKGSEVILMPIWGGDLTLTKARAIENQVYLVTSTYTMKSAIFDLTGEIIEEATEINPVVITEVDLNKQILWPWLGDLKNRIPREIPSEKVLIR